MFFLRDGVEQLKVPPVLHGGDVESHQLQKKDLPQERCNYLKKKLTKDFSNRFLGKAFRHCKNRKCYFLKKTQRA